MNIGKWAATPFVIALGISAAAVTGESAIGSLKKGNESYVSGQRAMPTGKAAEKPIAVVLASSDIGVPPESLFQARPGELVVLQNTGPVIDEATLEAIRFYCEEKKVDTLVVLAGHHSSVTKLAIEKRATDVLPHIKDPILASLVEIERDHRVTFRKLEPAQQVDEVTKMYVENLEADFQDTFNGKHHVEVFGALVEPENGKLDWLTPVKRKSGARFGQHQSWWGGIGDGSGL